MKKALTAAILVITAALLLGRKQIESAAGKESR